MGKLRTFQGNIGDSLKVIRRFSRGPKEAKEFFIDKFLGSSRGASRSFEAFCGL